MSNARVAITGATGQIGGLVATRLASAGKAQRLLVRAASVSRAPQLAGAEIAVASYEEPEAAAEALKGIEVLLMVSAAESADRIAHHARFIDAAAKAGVKHVVYTSFLGAAKDCTFTLGRDHWATEEHLRASGMR